MLVSPHSPHPLALALFVGRAGSIPFELGGLVALENLNLGYNHLSGKCCTSLAFDALAAFVIIES